MNFFQEILKTLEDYKHPRRVLSSTIALLGALILSMLIGYKTLGIVLQERAVRREVKSAEARVEKMRTANQRLDKEISETRLPEVIEKLAKSQLNLKLPGELVAVIVNSASNTEPAAMTKPTLWERLKSLLRL